MEPKQEEKSFTLKKRWFVINQDEDSKIEDFYDFEGGEGDDDNVVAPPLLSRRCWVLERTAA